MKQNDNTTPEQGHSANMLLYAVAPTPKLSTDSKALDSVSDKRGLAIGATSKPIQFYKQVHLYIPEIESGSCYPTVYACLLGVELHKVPHFNLFYWSTNEKLNLATYFQNRFLDGKSRIDFDGEDYKKTNFDHFSSMAACLWDNVRTFWLASQGFAEQRITDIDEWLKENPNKAYMASGKSSRGVEHVVLYMNGEFLHDPHPSGEGLISLNENYPFSYLHPINK
jgi:hypothetical protein